MKRELSILMIAAEAHPLAKVGGLADVMGSLPQALADRGHDVRMALPFYGPIRDKIKPPGRVKGAELFDVALGDETYPATVWSTKLPGSKVRVYLIENDAFFDRDGIYVDPASGEPYPDDAERFVFFSRAALRLTRLIGWEPDVLHCHDHQTGFIPAWVKYKPAANGLSDSLRTLFTIHNLAYQGSHPREVGYKAGFGEEMLQPGSGLELNGKINAMKSGVTYADTITTVSPTYAKEIQTPQFGYGLEGVLRSRSEDLVGILNGADYDVWDPERDKIIPCKYNQRKLHGKHKCRWYLIGKLGLKITTGTPVVGMISRLVAQKGFDILTKAFDRIMELDVGLVILGLGEKRYHDALTGLAARFKDRVSVNLAFDEVLAHEIEAGSDMFLMPSKYEPCGLNQMYSMRYGTIPVVRGTGGLADTVTDPEQSGESTGFVFNDYSAEALVGAIKRAREAYADKDRWLAMVRRAMSQDFSWDRSARTYEEVYLDTLKKRRVVTAS
jgi:starch synthase